MSAQVDENSTNATRIGRLCDRLALAGFLVYALVAPHSIAGAWIGISVALLAWIIRALSTRRTGLRRTALDLPLLCFIGWTILSSLFSAEPRESIAKLVNVSTFLMFYLTQSFLTRRRAVLLAAVLILSGAAGVLWGAGGLIVGPRVVRTAP